MTKSLQFVLEQYAPDTASSLGLGLGPQRTGDVDRFREDLEAIAHRLRRQVAIVYGVVLAWFAILVTVALLASDPFTSVLSLGTAGGGTIWCVNILLRVNRELFFIEILVAAASRRDVDLDRLVALCRDQLRVLPRRRSPRRRMKPVVNAAPTAWSAQEMNSTTPKRSGS